MQRLLLKCNGMYAFMAQVEQERLKDDVELEIARLERNWPNVVSVLQRRVDRLAPGGERALQDLQWLELEHQLALQYTQKWDEIALDGGGHAAATAADWAEGKALVNTTYARAQYQALTDLSEAAQLAGNAAVLMATHNRMQSLAAQFCQPMPPPPKSDGNSTRDGQRRRRRADTDQPAKAVTGIGPKVGWHLIGIDRWGTWTSTTASTIGHWYEGPKPTRYYFRISPVQQVAASWVSLGGDREQAAKIWYDDFEDQLATNGEQTEEQKQAWRDKLFLGEKRARRVLLPAWWPPIESSLYAPQRGQDQTPPGLKVKPGTISFW
jgi:hypothetical protein